MDIISKKLANNQLYAYSKGRFWRWDEDRSVWKESHLLTKKYDLNHEVDTTLSPEDFLSDPSQFQALEDYEVDYLLKNALKDAQPCQNAPVDPVQETAVVPAPDTAPAVKAEEKPLTTIPDAIRPAFDFSALGELSTLASEADRQFDLHYGTAQDEYLISCIYLAKVHELTAKAGRYGGGTWTKWYESKGLSHGSATKMVQNGKAFKSSTVDDLKQLPDLTRKDLNLIARSGCADQLLESAGDSQRVQELLEQLKAEKDRADAAEAREEEAWSMVSKAQEETQTAKNKLEASIVDVQGLTEKNSQLERRVSQAEQECMDRGTECIQATARATKAEQRAKAAEDALKHQPITGVVDKEEVRRQADELARRAKEQAARQVQDAQRATAAVQAEFDQFRQAADGFLAPEQVCTQQAQLIANAMRSMYLNWFGNAVAAGAPLTQAGAPLYALCGEILTSLEDDISINPTAAGSEEDAEREALFE